MCPCTKPQWVAHPHPRRGEILSSWLSRCAFANGLSGHCFTQRAFSGVPIWTRDIDRFATESLLAEASDQSRIKLRNLRKSVLRCYEGRVFAPGYGGSVLPWITPAGIYHRVRRHHGSAYCPLCLAEYGCAMLVWRLAWMVHCPRHELPLRDACPQCDAPFVFHRIALGDPGRLPCPGCGYNLLRAAAVELPVTMQARSLQRALTCSSAGHIRMIGGRALSPLEFSQGLRFLISILYPNKHFGGLAEGVRYKSRRHLGDPIAPSTKAFEHWRIRDRAVALSYLAEVMDQWPVAFIKAISQGEVSFSRPGATAPPAWILQGGDRNKL